MNALLERIEALLGGAPHVLELERLLTDGYAKALELEAERLRIERRMDGVTTALEADLEGAKELSVLAERRAGVDRDLTDLRERLSRLKERTREVRTSTVIPQPGLS